MSKSLKWIKLLRGKSVRDLTLVLDMWRRGNFSIKLAKSQGLCVLRK